MLTYLWLCLGYLASPAQLGMLVMMDVSDGDVCCWLTFHVPVIPCILMSSSLFLIVCLLSSSQDMLRPLSLCSRTSALHAFPSREMGEGLGLVGQTPGLELGSTLGGVGLASAKTELWAL